MSVSVSKRSKFESSYGIYVANICFMENKKIKIAKPRIEFNYPNKAS